MGKKRRSKKTGKESFTLTMDELSRLVNIIEQFETDLLVRKEGKGLWFFYRKDNMDVIGVVDEY